MNQNINNKYKMYVFFNQHLDIKMIMLKRQHQLTLKELDEVKAERFPNANRELERFYPEYPAHIHIDILKEYTGNGVCSKLMQALFEVLKEEKVPGICVLVDTNNKRAVRFYEKMGFKAFEENPGIMLCKLD